MPKTSPPVRRGDPERRPRQVAKASRQAKQGNPELAAEKDAHKAEKGALKRELDMMTLHQQRQTLLASQPVSKEVHKTARRFPMKSAVLMLIVSAVAYKLGPERLKQFVNEDFRANVSNAMMKVNLRMPSMERLYAFTKWPVTAPPPDVDADSAESANPPDLEASAKEAAECIEKYGWWAVFKMNFRSALAFCAYNPIALTGVAGATVVAVMERLGMDFENVGGGFASPVVLGNALSAGGKSVSHAGSRLAQLVTT